MSLFTKKKFLAFFIVFFGLFSSNAQKKEIVNQKLIDQYKAYFSTPRKSIHLHLNKTTFVSGEQIWFSTYLYNKKENAISLKKEYINVNLINSHGEVLSSKTVLHSENNGYSDILLLPSLPTGDYYLQAHTTAMQNFIEDDSAIYKIKVLNFEDDFSAAHEDSIDFEKIQIEIQPESGQLLEGILGTCAIRISDTNNNAVTPDKVLLKSTNGSHSTNVSINEIGMGRFSLIPNSDEQYEIEVYVEDSVFTQKVPTANVFGYSISVDFNYAKDLVLVSIHTNDQLIKQPLSLIAHKDGNLFTVPVRFNKKEKTAEIIIPFSSLFTGVNTLSLAVNNTVLAERLIFIHPDQGSSKPQLVTVKQHQDSTIIFIKNNADLLSNANNLSISVLPQTSLSDSEYQNLPSSFFLSGNLPNETIAQLQKIRFIEEDKAKHVLDNALILEGWGRYQWRNISNPNLIRAEKITGLSQIDGYVNLFNAKNDSLTVMLYSTENGLFETTLLNEEKKFRFNNLALTKGSKFSLTLLNQKGKPVYGNFFFTTIPEKEKYRHSYIPTVKNNTSQKLSTRENPNLFFKRLNNLKMLRYLLTN